MRPKKSTKKDRIVTGVKQPVFEWRKVSGQGLLFVYKNSLPFPITLQEITVVGVAGDDLLVAKIHNEGNLLTEVAGPSKCVEFQDTELAPGETVEFHLRNDIPEQIITLTAFYFQKIEGVLMHGGKDE